MRLSTTRSRIIALVSSALAATSVVSLAPAANAAVPSIVNIRLSSDDKAGMEDKTYWWNQPATATSFMKFVVAGDDLVLHYTVTDKDDKALANTLVTLKKDVGGGSFSGTFTGTTDANGQVTFSLRSTTSAAAAEPYPGKLAGDLSTLTHWDDATRCSGNCSFTEIKYDLTPTVGAGTENIDRVWTHTVKPQNYVPTTPPPAVANIRLSDDDKLSMTDKSYWWTNEPASKSLVKFVVAGDTLTLHYRVTDGSGKAVANIPLVLNPSNVQRASFSGSTSVNTDANGYATFNLVSTTSVDDAEPAPTAPSNINFFDDSRVLPKSAEATYEFNPSVGAATQHVDRVWSHTVKSAGSSVVPDKVSIRLASSFVDPKWNAYEATDWIAASYPANTKAYVKYVDAGATANLTYRATNATTGDPIINAMMTLIVNPGGEKTSYTSGSTTIAATATVRLTARTDSSGYVTFALTNTNTSSQAETAPPALNVVNPSWNANPKVELGGSLQPTMGAKTESVDLLFPHITKSGGSITTAGLPASVKIRLTSPSIDTATNAYDASAWVAQYFALGTKAYVQYVPVGSTMTLTYKVTDSAGVALPNTNVRLKVNANGDKPSFTSGNVVIASGNTVYLSGKTDANGNVTFNLTNTNDTAIAEPVPTKLNDVNPSWTANPPVELGGNVQVTAGAGSEVTDLYFPHFTKVAEQVKAGTPAAPTLTNVIAGNAKLTIGFTAGASGSGGAIKYYGYSLDGGKTWVDNSKNTKSPIILTTGLVNGTTYLVKVRAFNAVGNGYSSNVIAATPVADAPSAPTLSGVTAGAGQITVAFKAGSNGGAAITKFQISTDGSTWSDLSSVTSPVVVTGLGYGVAYSVTIRAVNSTGPSPASAAKAVTTLKLSQTITFKTPAAMKVGAADQALDVSTTAQGLTVTLATSSAAVCTIVNGKLHAVGKGSCTITASQLGDARYSAAKAVAVKATITL